MSYAERRRRKNLRGRGYHCTGCGRKIYHRQAVSGLIRGMPPYDMRHDGCPAASLRGLAGTGRPA